MSWLRSDRLFYEVILYIGVGLLGLVVDFLFFFLAQRVGWTLLISQWIGATAGFIHNHIWHHYKVFSHSEKFTKTTFWSVNVSALSILVTGPLLLVLQSIVPSVVVNKMLLIVIMSAVQFIFRKFVIFKSRKPPALELPKC